MSESGDVEAGEIFAAVIDYELEQERARRTSLEQRAMAVVTSSGVLVSLVFGMGVGRQPTNVSGVCSAF